MPCPLFFIFAPNPEASVELSSRKIITLEQFIIESEAAHPLATGEFSQLLRDIALAAKLVNREVNKAGLVDILGLTGEVNVQGEHVQKLDVFANDTFLSALAIGGQVCVIGSEENEDVIPVSNAQSRNARYVVLMDPLDGSSNIDVNVAVGTIFSVYERMSPKGGPGGLSDCMQKGSVQVAAGYVIYGSSTMIVYTTGHGVNGFTLDPSIGEFLLSHPNIKLPARPKYYSVNQGYQPFWTPGVQAYTEWLQQDTPEKKGLSLRYIGSLVADFHRNLLSGGVFYYPADSKDPKKPGGKLRLVYEAGPLAFLIDQAGGYASDGTQAILDVAPARLHQRVPLFVGNRILVEQAEALIRHHDQPAIA